MDIKSRLWQKSLYDTNDSDWYLYILRAKENRNGKKSIIKIGMSNNPKKRIANLQTACPYELEIITAIKCLDREHCLNVERVAHKLYRKNRMRGEWFLVDAKQINGFAKKLEEKSNTESGLLPN